MLLAPFLADHVLQIRYAAPAALLLLFALGQGIAAVRQLAALHGLDFGGTIVEIQTRLGRLRAERLRVTMWTFLVAPLLWTPLLIVGFKGLFGVDAYAAFPGAWMLGNFLFGAALIPLGLWIAHRYAERMERSPLVQRVLRDLAGTNLNAAAGFLDTLARFAREEPA